MPHNLEEVLKRPLVTEKTSNLANKLKKFSFEIAPWATKDHVKEAFIKYFPKHKVLKVNIAKITGKSRRSRKGYTQPLDRKKAIVSLEGEHIEFFPQI